MPKQFYRPAVWSNFFYAVPLVVAFYYGLLLTAASVAALLVFSLAYHLSKEKRFIVADLLAAGIVILFCLMFLFLGGLRSGYVLLALLLVGAGAYIRYWLERGDRGGLAHGLWHLVAAAIILACIFSYLA